MALEEKNNEDQKGESSLPPSLQNHYLGKESVDWIIQAETTGEGRTVKLFSADSSLYLHVRWFSGLFTISFSNRQAINHLRVGALQKN